MRVAARSATSDGSAGPVGRGSLVLMSVSLGIARVCIPAARRARGGSSGSALLHRGQQREENPSHFVLAVFSCRGYPPFIPPGWKVTPREPHIENGRRRCRPRLFLTTVATAPARSRAGAGPPSPPDGCRRRRRRRAAPAGDGRRSRHRRRGRGRCAAFPRPRAETTDDVASATGDAYAGAWLDETTRTVYAAVTTDAASTAAVDCRRRAGSRSRTPSTTSKRSPRELETAPFPTSSPRGGDRRTSQRRGARRRGGRRAGRRRLSPPAWALQPTPCASRRGGRRTADLRHHPRRHGLQHQQPEAAARSVYAVQGGFVTAGHCR